MTIYQNNQTVPVYRLKTFWTYKDANVFFSVFLYTGGLFLFSSGCFISERKHEMKNFTYFFNEYAYWKAILISVIIYIIFILN